MSRVLIGSLITAAALSAVLFWEAQDPWRPDTGVPPDPSVPGAALDGSASEMDGAAEGWLATALARPLFQDDRRPPKALQLPTAAQDAPARLTGVVTGPFGARAIFMTTGTAKPVVAEQGARVGQFVIRFIEPGRVVVEANGEILTLMPSFAPGNRLARR